MIASVVYSEKGEVMFKFIDISNFESFPSTPNFLNYIKDIRIKAFMRFVPALMQSNKAHQASDPWWQLVKKRKIIFSLYQTLDETMSAFRSKK